MLSVATLIVTCDYQKEIRQTLGPTHTHISDEVIATSRSAKHRQHKNAMWILTAAEMSFDKWKLELQCILSGQTPPAVTTLILQ